MRGVRRLIGGVVALAIVAGIMLTLWSSAKGKLQDLPWTPLDLGEGIGGFTGRKLSALSRDFPACRRLLDRAGVRYTVLPSRREGEHCGYDDAVRFADDGARTIAYSPAAPGVACPVAAALAMWEWDVVQPAALAAFGSRVTSIEQFGSYHCRRLYGRDQGSFSEHATANAIDIAGVRLADGTHITVAADWRGDGRKARFLHKLRDGACDLFATTLSPDYNAAHHDHLHLDKADRGVAGWRACR